MDTEHIPWPGDMLPDMAPEEAVSVPPKQMGYPAHPDSTKVPPSTAQLTTGVPVNGGAHESPVQANTVLLLGHFALLVEYIAGTRDDRLQTFA
jgi:hypothetical protein